MKYEYIAIHGSEKVNCQGVRGNVGSGSLTPSQRDEKWEVHVLAEGALKEGKVLFTGKSEDEARAFVQFSTDAAGCQDAKEVPYSEFDAILRSNRWAHHVHGSW